MLRVYSLSQPHLQIVLPLLAMEVSRALECPGAQKEEQIEDFFKGPGQTCMDMAEILTRTRIPGPIGKTTTSFLKVGRVSTDIAVVNAAE